MTTAPLLTSSFAAAIPLRAAPATVTRLRSTSNPKSPAPSRESRVRRQSSPKFQRRQTEQREDDPDDHKPRDHLRFAPPHELEVVVQRRHLEHALSGQLERGDLDDHRQRFEDEDAADDAQQQLLFDENG